MGGLPIGGAMCALFADEAAVETLCKGHDGIGIAAINSPLSTVVAGDEEAVNALMARAEKSEISCRKLNVSHAFHSYLMAPVEIEFLKKAAKIKAHSQYCAICRWSRTASGVGMH